MVLDVCCESELISIEVAGEGGRRGISVDGKEEVIEWVRLPDGGYSILFDGRVYDLSAEIDGDSYSVAGRRGRCSFHVRDPRRLDSSAAAEQGTAGLQRLLSDMPGKVVRVLVRENDTVTYDQGLLVVEAMKMQNEIRAPKAGIIKSIGVSAGRTVNTGDFLLSLE